MSQVMQYVRFDKDTGRITSISGAKDETLSYIEVPLEDVMTMKMGIEPFSNYKVDYNPRTKTLELVSKAEYVLDGYSVSDFIYEMPDTEIKDADITVIQDIPNTCWKIAVGKTLRRNIREKGINLNTSMMFSVTAKGDPNVLYKTLFAHTAQTVNDNYCIIPFSMPFETTNEPISVYTSRKFDTYQFKRVI
tara:strand:- start:10193 stop:10765 length:573 start_codon:yes stop_codon:yes gene_type:complete